MVSPHFEVLQLGPFPPPHGGVQTNLVAIRDYLRTQEVPCRVINLTSSRRPDADGVFYPDGALATLGLLLRLPRTVIHLHIGGVPSPRLLLLGILCSLLPGSRTVLTFHSGGFPDSAQGRAANPRTLVAIAFRRFDRLIGVNRALTDFFVSKLGVPPERVRFILPYVLPERVPDLPLPADIEKFCATHSPVMVSMGWLEPEYDYGLQISALSGIRQSYPRAGLLILGEGRLRAELESQRDSTNCADAVLMPGDVSHDIALVAIARCDIFLRTTHYDGDSISVREALHFGTPVIATDNGMRPDGVSLMPVGDVGSLVEAVCNLAAQGKPPARTRGLEQENIHAVHALYLELIQETRS